MIEPKDFGIPWWLRSAIWALSLARKAGFRKQVVYAKQYVALQTLAPLHSDSVHSMRRLALDMLARNPDPERATREAMRVCTAFRKTMGTLLELEDNELHCSLKVFGDDNRILTWARSEPYDDRPHETGEDHSRPVTDGTVWCAILGSNDGITRWRRYRCFCSNDLPSAQGKSLFVCNRTDWQQYYKSVLVYPLMYRADADEKDPTVFGFLGFDSQKRGAFQGLPDIFDYRDPDQWGKFHDVISTKAAYHLGAAMADTLSVFLRPYYQQEPYGLNIGPTKGSQEAAATPQ